MPNAKVQGNRSIDSGDEGYFKAFTIYGRGDHIGHMINLTSPRPMEATYEIRLQICFVVSEEKLFELVDGPRRTTEPA